MLYNNIDNYIKKGKFPIQEEMGRINKLNDYLNMYEGNYGDVGFFVNQFERIGISGSYNILPLNYSKEIVLKIKNLTFNKIPNINYEYDNKFISILKEILIDYKRFGCSIIHTYLNNGSIRHNVIKPQNWYPVFNPMDTDEILQHVVMNKIEDKLYVQIFEKGKTILREYNINNGKIGRLNSEDEFITGLDDFAVSIIRNNETSDDLYGTSIYSDLENIIAQIIVASNSINLIIDKHVNPLLCIPESCVDFDEYGQPILKMENVLLVGPGDPLPQRVTWDSKLEAARENLNFWMKELGKFSGLGRLIMETDESNLVGTSGEALRRMNSNAISAINNVRDDLNKIIEEIILKECKLMNKKFKDLEISWVELFSDSENDKVDLVSKKIKSKLVSLEDAIIELEDIPSEEALIKAEKIKAENIIVE